MRGAPSVTARPKCSWGLWIRVSRSFQFRCPIALAPKPSII